MAPAGGRVADRLRAALVTGELTAYLREHYGTLGCQPWKMAPCPITRRSRDTERALRLSALSPGSKWGPLA